MKGWSKLANPVLRELRRRGCKVVQVKEKFGELRIYFDTPEDMPSDEVEVLRHAVCAVEAMSVSICICCGRPARMCAGGWIVPLCDRHRKEEGRVWNGDSPTFVTNAYTLTEEELKTLDVEY